jgi:phasin family protein
MADAGAKKGGFLVFNTANNGLLFSGLEVETMFASQRRNVEAIMQANRLAFDGVQAVWRRQLDFVQEAVEGSTTHLSDLAPPSRPLNEKFAKHAEYSKQAFEKNLANARELTEIAIKMTTDATNIINQRVCDGFDEVPYSRKSEP